MNAEPMSFESGKLGPASESVSWMTAAASDEPWRSRRSATRSSSRCDGVSDNICDGDRPQRCAAVAGSSLPSARTAMSACSGESDSGVPLGYNAALTSVSAQPALDVSIQLQAGAVFSFIRIG